MPPSSLACSLPQTTDDPAPAYRNIPLPRLNIITAEPRPATLRTRWERFDARIRPPRRTGFAAGCLALRAKYAVDVAFFSIKSFSNTLGDATELRYSRGQIRRASTAYSDPSPPSAHHAGPITLEDARLKFDFEMASSKPYVGTASVLPFGD